METIAIIGGGFSGTATAVNLARLARTPRRIILINHGYPLGRGVAYGTKRPEHLLNVAARNMSALPDQSNHLVDWLRTRCDFAEVPDATLREQFIPRRVYGDYIQNLLFTYRHGMGASPAGIETIEGEVLDIIPGGRKRASVVVAGQATIEADSVLLATGNQAPAENVLPVSQFAHPRYLANPWQNVESRLIDRRDNVILLGAGLTMIDVFLTLTALDWQGTIYAVSRSGLLPLSHFKGVAYPDFSETVATLGLTRLAGLMEKHCADLRALGENPAIAVDKLRPFTQRIWQNFTLEEKQRFCKEYRTRWNVTRHRIAPSIHRQITDGIASGKLRVVKGSVIDVAASADRIQVTVRTGPTGQREVLDGGWLMNCTGPQESFKNSSSVLVQNLFDRGLVQADELDMGIKIGPNFAVIDGGGYVSPFLYAVGPPLKGTLWETTAVPELRIQAQCVAEAILSKVDGGPSHDWAEMYVEVLEYSI